VSGRSKWSEIRHKGPPRSEEQRAREHAEYEALIRRYNQPWRRLRRLILRRDDW
jgi:hypothetical protein